MPSLPGWVPLPLRKIRILMKMRLILLQNLPPLGTKQGQNLNWKVSCAFISVFGLTGRLSCASSNFCRRAQTEPRLSPLKPALPWCNPPDAMSGQLPGHLTFRHPGPLPTGEEYARGLWHLGFPGSSVG